MHVNQFMNAHLNDMARTNRFTVEIHGPQGINLNPSMRCTNVSMPGRSISTNRHTVNQAGPPREFPSIVDYGGSVELTFMLDTLFEDHQKIHLWNSYIYDEAWAFRYPEEYWGTVKITQLDRMQNEIYQVELLEAWPSAFGALSYDSTGEGIQTFTCTFTYRSWTSSYENVPSGLLGGIFKQASRRLGSKIRTRIEKEIYEKVGAGGIAGKVNRAIDKAIDRLF